MGSVARRGIIHGMGEDFTLQERNHSARMPSTTLTCDVVECTAARVSCTPSVVGEDLR